MNPNLLVLVDNRSERPGLRTEHGLSMLLGGPDGQYLFDAATTAEALLANAEALQADLGGLDGAIVSHGHYDHTGGLAAVASRRRPLDVYAHPRAFAKRWSDRVGQAMRDISCPHSQQKLRGLGAVLHMVEAPTPLWDGLVLSGPIGGPRVSGDHFVIRRDDEIVVDPFEDELFLLVRGARGWWAITGCCHRGVRNTLRTARFLTHDEPLAGLIGGLHLRSATDEQLDEAIALFEEHELTAVYPCHCTGAESMAYLAQHAGGRVQPIAGGARIEL